MLPKLRLLQLINVAISDTGIAHLHSMKQLESFYLDGGTVSDDAIVDLIEAIPGLHVHIDQHHHDLDPQAHSHVH